MKLKTTDKWLEEANYSHIELADFSRGADFFEGNHAEKEMDEAEFVARLAMAKVRFRTTRYRKKPKEVNACQLKEDTTITTPNGRVFAREGDYVIYDEAGEPHPIKKLTFEEIYEPLSGETNQQV